MKAKWKYVVYVGGCDDYYTEYGRAYSLLQSLTTKMERDLIFTCITTTT